jgi:hypothetical protein
MERSLVTPCFPNQDGVFAADRIYRMFEPLLKRDSTRRLVLSLSFS